MGKEESSDVLFSVFEFNVVRRGIFFESVDESVILEETFGVCDVLGNKLSDAAKVW